ncbi:MAG TPA: N-acetylmuramoyl-L-alanine amidase [Caulobacteraceae bacterium]|nr:N-acetylmuramoyl-L-alanine amidase [Caulobacteraceae bacterium]
MPPRLLGAIGSAWGRLAASLGALLCLATAAAQSPPATDGVVGVRLGGDLTTTRVVIELDQAAKGRLIAGAGAADQPIVLALPGVSVETDRQGPGLGLVSGWSVDNAAGAARVRLMLARSAVVSRRFLLPPADGVTVYRYVVDLAPTAAGATTTTATEAAPLRQLSTEAQPPHTRKVIVIDPGHGGHDPGALGANTREKDLNLAAARVLKAKLEATGRYRVVMTRESDVYIPLETRVQIARRANADLFISLHSDSGGPQSTLHGATVYTLSDKGSERVVHGVTDRNDWLMSADAPAHAQAVNEILHDLTQRATRNRSAAFAEDLVAHIGDRAQAHAGHRDAGFMVLLAPDVPAVLLEMGFITNADDERLLASPAQRDHFMGEVAASIDAYFRQPTMVASR